MRYGTGTWAEKLGNHRAVVKVAAADAVWAHIPWRRRDAQPQRKAVWVTDAAGNRMRNVARVHVLREHGDLVFQPSAGAGTYYVYYMPYRVEGWWAFPTVRYIAPRSTAEAAWLAKHKLGPKELAGGAWKSLPRARVTQIQAINDFHRFDPMEVPATAAEMKAFLGTHGDRPYLLFPEDRKYPIRMTDELPLRWVRSGPADAFRGQAMRGEFYAFQIGVYAVARRLEDVRVAFTDLRARSGSLIPAAAVRCFNVGGTDCLGRPFVKNVSVEKGKVRALWLGVQVPADAPAATYSGTITLKAPKAPAAEVKLTLAVSKERIDRAGDHELWRHARLRWLDSKIALDDEVFAPYPAVKVSGPDRTVRVLGRQLSVGPAGLPERIRSTFSASVDSADGPPREILAAPVRLVVKRAKAAARWRAEAGKITQQAPGAATWESVSLGAGLTLRCRAKMECDGYVNYRLTLTADRAASLDDVRLEIPFRRDVARYMIGLGRKGGPRPAKWDWKWDLARANNHVWLGDVSAGLQCKLKHVRPHWGLYGLQDVGLYKDWSGQGKGGCAIREEGDAVVFRAFTGPMKVAAGQELHFNFGLLITPVKVLDKAHWKWRYFHSGSPRPVREVAKTGATIVNIHQGPGGLNPYINYPFRTADKLAAYAREARAAGMKVKIYYTVRELSNYCSEFWALRSLGDEVFRDGPGFKLADHGRKAKDPKARPKTGSAWLCEHAVSGYVPAWHQPLGNGHCDAAVAQQGLSRWHNYYLEGLDYLVRHVGVDGLYLDGIGYDREIMKRVRKVLLRGAPAGLIDFHSGNNFHPNYGMNNVAGQYMELFPYIDSLWFGEGFDYNESPDYWLVEISGIPFGLFGEMLQRGGNPWRGMVYGMTNRLGWGGDPRAIWKLWDEFGIDKARMIGYWDPACPVKTARKDVLATAYVRKGRTLIALASWAPKPLQCKLDVDFKAVGLPAGQCRLYAPPIENFQPAALFKTTDAIRVHPGRGWLLVLDDRPHKVPAPVTEDPYAGRQTLLEEKFAGTALDGKWKVRLSRRAGTNLKLAGGAVHIEAAANSFAYAERALPPAVGLVACLAKQHTDRGASWGPGLALVWKDGRALRVNIRAEGRFGVYGYRREILAGLSFPSDEYHLVIRLDPKTILVQVSQDGRIWQTLATIPRSAFPGDPAAVRVGKMGLPRHDRDYATPGPPGACWLRRLRVLGPVDSKPKGDRK